MQYNFLGNTGIKVSRIGLGNWLSKTGKEVQEQANQIVQKAWDLGINFFDTAEIYGFGQAEEQLGIALANLKNGDKPIRREDIIVTSKVWIDDPQMKVNRVGTSAKRVHSSIRNMLKRLQLTYVDVIYAHRYDHETSMEEICRSFHQVIEDGLAFYWGTSEWTSTQIVEAIQLCDRLNLHKPITEQPQYNMLERTRFEVEYDHIFSKYKYGSTVWSPLGGGLLTGKYVGGVAPEGSRFDNPENPLLKMRYLALFGPENKEKGLKMLEDLNNIAKELGGSCAQLAMAWVLLNKNVSVALTGASNVGQLEDTVNAFAIVDKLTPEISDRIEKILNNRPNPGFNFKTWSQLPFKR